MRVTAAISLLQGAIAHAFVRPVQSQAIARCTELNVVNEGKNTLPASPRALEK